MVSAGLYIAPNDELIRIASLHGGTAASWELLHTSLSVGFPAATIYHCGYETLSSVQLCFTQPVPHNTHMLYT